MASCPLHAFDLATHTWHMFADAPKPRTAIAASASLPDPPTQTSAASLPILS